MQSKKHSVLKGRLYNQRRRSRVNEIAEIKRRLKTVLKNHPQVVSVYIYGGLISKRVHAKSDLDLFIILSDHHNPTHLINQVYSEIKKLGFSRRLDCDFCFESEARNLLHGGKAQSQYLTVSKTGLHIHGKPYLKNLGFSLKEFHLTVASIAQRIRHEVVNNFGEVTPEYARKKVLYEYGSLAYVDKPRHKFHPFDNLAYTFRKYPQLRKYRNILMEKGATLKDIWEASEALRLVIEKKMKKL